MIFEARHARISEIDGWTVNDVNHFKSSWIGPLVKIIEAVHIKADTFCLQLDAWDLHCTQIPFEPLTES